MMTVTLTTEADAQINALPVYARALVRAVVDRLADWPNVSGVKPMKREWRGHYRIRTGDYRVVFTATASAVTVVRVGNRKDVYDE